MAFLVLAGGSVSIVLGGEPSPQAWTWGPVWADAASLARGAGAFAHGVAVSGGFAGFRAAGGEQGGQGENGAGAKDQMRQAKRLQGQAWVFNALRRRAFRDAPGRRRAGPRRPARP